jgi:hypothetical protein
MPLTDIVVRTAKPVDKLKKLSDGQGLQLWCEASGAKRWRLAYRFGGKQKCLALLLSANVPSRSQRGP